MRKTKVQEDPFEDPAIVWLPKLYSLRRLPKKEDYGINVSICGYKPGMYYEKHGTLYKADGTPGKLSGKPRTVPGKSNTKSPLEAAKLYATQQWEQKIRIDQYYELKKPTVKKLLKLREESGVINPSLCKKIKDCKDSELECTKKQYWIAQDKIDGDRILVFFPKNGPNLEDAKPEDIKIVSRNNIVKNFKEGIKKDCLKLLKYISKVFPAYNILALDGELRIPGIKHHEDVRSASATQTKKHHLDDRTRFYFFDLIIHDKKFKTRDAIRYELKDYILKRENIIFVESVKCTSWEEIKAYFQQCLEIGGKEGIVLRRGDHFYPRDRNVRSFKMIKMKHIEDSEYEVIGYSECQGANEGCILWELRDPERPELKFTCGQNGDFEFQKELLTNGEDYIGKYLTVEYSGFGKKGLPKFPKALRFRSIDDLPTDYRKKNYDDDDECSLENEEKAAVKKLGIENSEDDFVTIKSRKFACDKISISDEENNARLDVKTK